MESWVGLGWWAGGCRASFMSTMKDELQYLHVWASSFLIAWTGCLQSPWFFVECERLYYTVFLWFFSVLGIWKKQTHGTYSWNEKCIEPWIFTACTRWLRKLRALRAFPRGLLAMIESQLANKQMKTRLKMSWEKGSARAATGQKKKRFVAVAWRSTAHYGRRLFVCNKQGKGSVKFRRKQLTCLRSAVNHVKSCSFTLLPLPEPQRASSRRVWFWSPPAVHRCPSGESNFSPSEAFRTLYPQTLNLRPGTVEHDSGD